MTRARRFQGAKTLLQTIQREFGTLPFCRRYLDQVGETRHILSVRFRVPRKQSGTDDLAQLKHLVDNGIVRGYPPLADVKGCVRARVNAGARLTSAQLDDRSIRA